MVFQNVLALIDGHLQKTNVKTDQNRITEIGDFLQDSEITDGKNFYLIPGLVEIHSHGCVGEDFSTSDISGVEKMRAFYLQNGITSVCATTMTENPALYRKAMQTIRSSSENKSSGARIIGINMEGPFLSAEKKGAHDEQYLMNPNTEYLEELDQLSGNRICLIDLAPELPGAMELIQKYKDRKILSIAHTSCNYETALQAFDHGASHVTHLFNAMNDPRHREPGIVGAVMDRNVYAELICDGIHNHPTMIRMMFMACPEKIVLISDSMSACGMPDGKYVLGGLDVFVKNQRANLEDGTIAGSAVTVMECMKRTIQFGVKPEAAFTAATENPAKSLKLDTKIGVIRPGNYADLILLSPDFNLQAVYLDGKRIK